MLTRTKLLIMAAVITTVVAAIISSQRTGAGSSPDIPFSNRAQERLQDRRLERKPDSDPPVKITLVRAKGGLLEIGKTLAADDDWLRGLTIKVLNDSGKTISFIGLALSFRRTPDQEKGLPGVWPIHYGVDPFWDQQESMSDTRVNVLSGKTVEITLSDPEYDEIKSFLRDIGFPASIKKADLSVTKVGFTDGTAWNAGRVYRRDPMHPRKWRPIDEPEAPSAPVRQSRATLGSSFFLKAGFYEYDKIATSVSLSPPRRSVMRMMALYLL